MTIGINLEISSETINFMKNFSKLVSGISRDKSITKNLYNVHITKALNNIAASKSFVEFFFQGIGKQVKPGNR